MSNGCQTTLNPFSIHSRANLIPIKHIQMFDIAILFKNKSINFRYMYQLQNHTNVGYSNLKNLKNYGSLTLRTIEKHWQFTGKSMALTFKVSEKVSKVSK